MARALVLGISVVSGLAAAIVVMTAACGSTPVSDSAAGVRLTRIFVPAIQRHCLEETRISPAAVDFLAQLDGGTDVAAAGTAVGDAVSAGDRARLESCLDRYPVDPYLHGPYDLYSREMLYTYYESVLLPCLREFEPSLDPLRDRVYFVSESRLEPLSPYSQLTDRPLDELLKIAAACPERPAYLAD